MELHEHELMQMVMTADKALVIDGSWTAMPEETVTQDLQTLLDKSRRAPEIVVVLKCKKQTMFDRCIDLESIKTKCAALLKARKQASDDAREEAKKEKLAELAEENKQDPEDEARKSDEEVTAIIQEAIDEWEKERIAADEEADEADDEKPSVEKMLEEEKEKLEAQLEKDNEFLDAFMTDMKEKRVEVMEVIETEVSADYV